MRKKIDSRIRTLVENGVKSRSRSMFIIIGDKARDQIVNLHYMLSKAVIKSRPSVLWCYQKDLYLSSHKQKRLKQIKKMMQRGLLDPEKDDPFSLFMASTNIRYCYYSETHKILGNTYGMCVLQDFEAITPNLLARTIETVEGGGIIVLLLNSLTSLTRLYTMTMNVHSRFRTESHHDVVGRFNERFILSLSSCLNAIVMDDELNILPISSQIKNISPIDLPEGEERLTESERDLKELKESLKEIQPMGALVDKCRTLDQAKAVITFLDAISEKSLRTTVALTSSRGRGKSAALGVSVAGAIALGYSNIFVTAPSPENLKTLFEFILKGFDSMEYKEHIDYDMIQSSNPDFNKAIIRINVYRQHRQTIQYIQPQHYEKASQAELLVIDEAAAIPLPIVRSLLGPYLVFICSTVNGYEGTGRSLSLKLIQELREKSNQFKSNSNLNSNDDVNSSSGRMFKEVELTEPIRYGLNDPIESWLNKVLCLDATSYIPKLSGRLPSPNECELYYVNRDTLFSYHNASELFLQRMMSLYVSSHYKNSPNDLQLMSDAPAHHLFVLLGPIDESQTSLPDILCVLQVCLEGKISQKSAQKSLSQGSQSQGDLIPWTVGQQYQDLQFPSLSGARIVRIAVHPDVTRAGYGSRAIELLARYYEGQFADLDEDENFENENENKKSLTQEIQKANLLEEEVKPKVDLPPLLVSLKERRHEKLHYLGVSFGLTQSLFNFWKKINFIPLYIRQTPSDITGEHTCIMVKPLRNDDIFSNDDENFTLKNKIFSSSSNWLKPYMDDFKRRFISLLSSSFRKFPLTLALSVLHPKIEFGGDEMEKGVDMNGILHGSFPLLTHFDLKRLESYSNNLVDYHLILDLIPTIARLYFLECIPQNLTYGQAGMLVSFGLQSQSLTDIENELSLPASQLLALFNKCVRKLFSEIHKSLSSQIEKELPVIRNVEFEPHEKSVDEDLDEGAKTIQASIKQSVSNILSSENLQKFSILGKQEEIEMALQEASGKLPPSGLISVKTASKANGLENENEKENRKGNGNRKEGSGQRRNREGEKKSMSGGKKNKKPKN